MVRILGFSAIIVLISICLARDLPANYPRCYIDDENLNSCLLKASANEVVRDSLKHGVTELGIPPVSPFTLPEISLQQGTDAVKFKILVRNATIRGLENYEFKEFSYDPKTYKWYGQVSFNSILVDGECEIDGKILLTAIRGKGDLSAETGECAGTYEITGELVKRKDVEYYNILDVQLKLSVNGGKVHFNRFSAENEELANTINSVIHEHGSELIKEIINPIEQVAGSIIKQLMGTITKKVPYKKLFPHS